MRSALLLAGILVLSLAPGAFCKKSQEWMVPDGGHKEVKYSSSWTYPGKVRGNVMGAVLPKAVGRKVEQEGWELPGLSIHQRAGFPCLYSRLMFSPSQGMSISVSIPLREFDTLYV